MLSSVLESCTLDAFVGWCAAEWLMRRPASQRYWRNAEDGFLGGRKAPFGGKQQQQVDIGVGEELPPAVAAHGGAQPSCPPRR